METLGQRPQIKNEYKLTELIRSDEEVRSLSWKQPYAQLMLWGKIETRTWSTKYRGFVLICASKKAYNPHEVFMISRSQTPVVESVRQTNAGFERKGQAIAIGKLIDCRPMTPEDAKLCFVEYSSNLYCHIYENVRPIVPFERKGTQGWKKLTEEEKSKIIVL